MKNRRPLSLSLIAPQSGHDKRFAERTATIYVFMLIRTPPMNASSVSAMWERPKGVSERSLGVVAAD
jgi:hypothetical protein